VIFRGLRVAQVREGNRLLRVPVSERKTRAFEARAQCAIFIEQEHVGKLVVQYVPHAGGRQRLLKIPVRVSAANVASFVEFYQRYRRKFLNAGSYLRAAVRIWLSELAEEADRAL